MSNITYKKYGDGFEEFQAQIYNSVAEKYGGQPVTAERIKKRLLEHQPTQDKLGITYAFDNNKPIAYIQYREYNQGKVRIGFPWAVEGTPIEVQDKLFYDLLDYLKDKYPNKKEFYLGNVNHVYTDIHHKILNHYGFQVDSWFAFYTLELNKINDINLPSAFTYEEVYQDSLDLICNICLTDKSLVEMGREGIKQFFKSRVFTDTDLEGSTVVILYKEDHPLATIAVTQMNQNDKEYSTVRIVGIKNGEEKIYQYLLVALAKVLKSKNIQNDLSIFVDDTVPYQEEFVKSLGAKFLSKAFEYRLQL